MSECLEGLPIQQPQKKGQQLHVELQHVQFQQQTLSAASRVEARGAGARSAVGAHEGRAGRGPSRALRKAGGLNLSGEPQVYCIFGDLRRQKGPSGC